MARYLGSQRHLKIPAPPPLTLEQIDNNLLAECVAWIAYRSVKWLHENRRDQLARLDNLLDRRLSLTHPSKP